MRRLSLIENGEEPDHRTRKIARISGITQRDGGRFLTADPYVASGGPADAQSWNRYSYVEADPVNRTDAWVVRLAVVPRRISSNPVLLFCAASAFLSAARAAPCPTGTPPSDLSITQALDRALPWYAFWYGAEGSPGFRSGTKVEAVVLQDHRRGYVVIAQIAIAVEFNVDRQGVPDVVNIGPQPSGQSNKDSIDEYENRLDIGASRGSANKAQRFERQGTLHDSGVDAARTNGRCQRTLTYQLPQTDFKPAHAEAASLATLSEQVRGDLRKWEEACKGSGYGKIPYFSRLDPYVFVFVELRGGDCSLRGLAVYSKISPGGWMSPVKIEPVDNSGARRQLELINSHRAAMVSIP